MLPQCNSKTRGKQLTLKSKPLKVEVLPPDPQFSGSVWLPARSLELDRNGIPQQAIQLGDAINMGTQLSALGLTGEQLTEVTVSDPQGHFNIYPDQPRFNNSAQGNWVMGQREQTFVLVPARVGTLRLPAIRVKWWDPQNKMERTAELASVEIEVAAADAGSVPTPPEAPEATPGTGEKDLRPAPGDPTAGVHRFWMWISLASFAAWGATLVYFLLFYRSRRAPRSESTTDNETTSLRTALRRIESAAAANQANRSWNALQEYGRLRWPAQPPSTPEMWTERLQSPEARDILAHLDASLFRSQNAEDWEGRDLLTQVIPLLRNSTDENRHLSRTVLPGLYPGDAAHQD